MIQDKFHQDKEAEKQRKKTEMQQENDRLAVPRKEIDRTQKRIGPRLQNPQRKRAKRGERERDITKEQEEIRLREQRRNLEKDISMGKAETSSNKAPPPPAPKTKAPPTNLLDAPRKIPTEKPQLSQEDERRCISREDEEHGDIIAGPTDIKTRASRRAEQSRETCHFRTQG